MQPITRRQFLVSAGGSVLTLILTSCAPQLAARQAAAQSAAPSSTNTPIANTPVPAVTATQPAATLVATSAAALNLPPAPTRIIITPQTELYQQNYDATPQVDLKNWNLTIDGLVDAPLKVNLDTIKALPKYDEVRTLECIGNPVGGSLIGNIEWNGIHLKDLLAKAKIDPKATHVNFDALDGYYTSVELDWVMQDRTMLVYGLNGEPLAAGHGFPLRINMPGLYGQKMPKWIMHIQFTDKPVRGYWESQGWSNVADVRTNSTIDFPTGNTKLPVGTVPIYGVAFAGKKKIVKVEVNLGDDAWQAAKLLPSQTPLVWTQWSLDWPTQPGEYKLEVRATDETGFVQNVEASGFLDGSYPNGTNSIFSTAVRVE